MGGLCVRVFKDNPLYRSSHIFITNFSREKMCVVSQQTLPNHVRISQGFLDYDGCL